MQGGYACLSTASLMIFVTSVANSWSTEFLSGCQRSRRALSVSLRSLSGKADASRTACSILSLMCSRPKTPSSLGLSGTARFSPILTRRSWRFDWSCTLRLLSSCMKTAESARAPSRTRISSAHSPNCSARTSRSLRATRSCCCPAVNSSSRAPRLDALRRTSICSRCTWAFSWCSRRRPSSASSAEPFTTSCMSASLSA
mmetsp:Transcript_40306/g.95495  ORF Transcript_40306/g.95495 Transcript_40306/m.95495 type:complete len:200 (+) Transcript_40306:45-644(+)